MCKYSSQTSKNGDDKYRNRKVGSLYKEFVHYIAAKPVNRRVKRLNTLVKRLKMETINIGIEKSEA